MGTRIEDTPVYRSAMAYAIAVDAFAEKLPMWRGYLKSQLRRSSLGGVLNLREGGSGIHPREKARIYRIGKREIAESITALDFTANVEPHLADEARRLMQHGSDVCTQLYRLSRSQMNRAMKKGSASVRREAERAPP